MTNLSYILLQQGAAPGGGLGNFGFIGMMIVIFAIMYFMMIRPQQKRQKEIQKMRENMKVGDKVVTAGGIHGKIKEINDTNFLVEIAENVRIRVDKASVFASSSDVPAGN